MNQLAATSYILQQLPNLVWACRTKRGDSLRGAATKIGVDVTEMSKFERGETNPTLATIRKYLAYLET